MAEKKYSVFPIGTPGTPWGEEERQQFRDAQKKHRDYFNEVVSPLHRINAQTHGCEVFQYGELDYVKFGAARFPLFAVRSSPWKSELPMVAITGGVHGYESSGVYGALLFVQKHVLELVTKGEVNVLVLPCVSPWGFEVIHRWTPEAIDPNRQFFPDKPGCDEAKFAMSAIQEHVDKSKSLLLHMDLHETTDTDNTLFTPAKFARDGLTEDKFEKFYEIPDGFYVYGDSSRKKPQDEFSKAIIEAVEKITHIAEAEEDGTLVGEKIAHRGILLAPGEGTADAHTKAMYVTTTEVYPDSKRTNPEACNKAQAEAVRAGINYAIQHIDDPNQ
mmetsp:Transcript_32727/g.51159  ORF Transcript_32727/g.51159 Transcript_32727/m.51159 type:complete len:330 (-) Transcript_32727:65-1054(-)